MMEKNVSEKEAGREKGVRIMVYITCLHNKICMGIYMCVCELQGVYSTNMYMYLHYWKGNRAGRNGRS